MTLLPTAELRDFGSTTVDPPSGSGQKHLIHEPRVLARLQCLLGFVPHHESPASGRNIEAHNLEAFSSGKA